MGGLTMVKNYGVMMFVVISIILTLMTASCAKKEIQADQAANEDGTLEAEVVKNDESINKIDADKKPSEEQLETQRIEDEKQAIKNEFVNENIYFGFDSATLTSESQEILRKKAQWLEQNPDVVIIIEGHCDNRGTEAYNLALGERRAESAKAFLADIGIDVTKIMTISYGEERPANPEETEEAWALNRRASFVIQ
jgi:peptidoglycan-associated lipoprotein